jgi:heterodisulfide reductase subunit B2
MKYAFFPGCSLQSTAKEYEESAKAISKVLNIELVEIPDWNCCGAIDSVYAFKPLYATVLATRNLALAERMQMDLVTPCSGCYFTLANTDKILKEDPETKRKVDEVLRSIESNYNGTVKVRHLADAILSDVGLQIIKENVKVQLRNLKVASYYGCLMVRPPKICKFDNSEHPTRLDDLVEALGASKIDYYGKTRCCGAALGFTDEEIMLKMSKDILISAKDAGANCVVTACSMCHLSLDARQTEIESHFAVKIDLPILHFTQLIGLAFGIEPRQLGLDNNCVSPKKILS